MALNPDLWGRLLEALEGRDVGFQWVKGHSGHTQNEMCDAMVGEASSVAGRRTNGSTKVYVTRWKGG